MRHPLVGSFLCLLFMILLFGLASRFLMAQIIRSADEQRQKKKDIEPTKKP